MHAHTCTHTWDLLWTHCPWHAPCGPQRPAPGGLPAASTPSWAQPPQPDFLELAGAAAVLESSGPAVPAPAPHPPASGPQGQAQSPSMPGAHLRVSRPLSRRPLGCGDRAPCTTAGRCQLTGWPGPRGSRRPGCGARGVLPRPPAEGAEAQWSAAWRDWNPGLQQCPPQLQRGSAGTWQPGAPLGCLPQIRGQVSCGSPG